MIEYIVLGVVLFVLSLIYFKVADKYNIIDKPNHRSAHTEITLRGGGIIIWFASLVYFMQHFKEAKYFFIGLSIMSVVSFWDDIQSLSNKFRLLAHFIAISLVFYSLEIFQIQPIIVILLSYVFFVGIINAYNFMDGINGITGIYTLVVFGSLWYVNENMVNFIDGKFLIYPIIASLVFLFFNFRKKARCFAGDIGSIGIAFWIVYVLIQLIIQTDSLIWILFLIIYGVDSVCTILHRLYLKENIFIAHRHHYYQILSNDYKLDHRIVSLIYGFLQVVSSIIVVKLYGLLSDIQIFVLVATPLLLLYTTKFYLIKKSTIK